MDRRAQNACLNSSEELNFSGVAGGLGGPIACQTSHCDGTSHFHMTSSHFTLFLRAGFNQSAWWRESKPSPRMSPTWLSGWSRYCRIVWCKEEVRRPPPPPPSLSSWSLVWNSSFLALERLLRRHVDAGASECLHSCQHVLEQNLLLFRVKANTNKPADTRRVRETHCGKLTEMRKSALLFTDTNALSQRGRIHRCLFQFFTQKI